MPDKYKYDVFISYSSKDKDWVRGELLDRIEDADPIQQEDGMM